MKRESNIPLVTVCLITYNQVGFIAQAVDSVLAQNTDFSWQLVIADDGSTDGTREILLAYRQKFPELIHLILQDNNIGAYRNWMDLITYPKSKYIAYLDGDDYWIDGGKLQKQVSFLEANPAYTICTHHVEVEKDGLFEETENLGRTNNGDFTIEDLANNNFIRSPSVVYRNGLIDKFPDWLPESPVGDYVLHLLNAKKGKIKYLSDTMAVYRTHQGGTWWGQPMESVLKKWLTVLSLLQTEPFEQSVLNQLKITWQRTASEYIAFLIDNNKPELREQLLLLTDQNHDLKIEWFDILIDNTLQLKAISGNYNGLRNSRLRKGLSHVFKQLKMS